MNQLEEIPKQDNEDQLSRGIGVSFALHALLISFFTLKAVFFTPESIDFTQAVRVDMVGLPDKIDPKELPPAATKEEAKAPEPKKPEPKVEKPAEKAPPPKPEVKMPPKVTKDPEAINLEKVKSKQQNALDKLKAMAALEKIKEDVAEEKAAEAAAVAKKAAQGSQKIKGNQVSSGSALTGLTKLQHETYIADLDRHIKQNWALPEWLAKRDLSAQVRVNIDARGLVISKKIVKSSGNPNYDEEVLATIEKSSPFPPPPDKFLSLVESEGILIGFPE